MRNIIIGIAGMRGFGKSTKLRHLLATEPRLIVADLMGEHGAWIGDVVNADIPDQIRDLDSRSGNFRVCYPTPIQDEEKQIFMEYLCKQAFQTAKKENAGVTLAIEECDRYMTRRSCNPGIEMLIQYGRHAPTNLVWVARSFADVYINLTSETDVHFLFNVQEPAWLVSLADRFGSEVADAVDSLPPNPPEAVNGSLTINFIRHHRVDGWENQSLTVKV